MKNFYWERQKSLVKNDAGGAWLIYFVGLFMVNENYTLIRNFLYALMVQYILLTYMYI